MAKASKNIDRYTKHIERYRKHKEISRNKLEKHTIFLETNGVGPPFSYSSTLVVVVVVAVVVVVVKDAPVIRSKGDGASNGRVAGSERLVVEETVEAAERKSRTKSAPCSAAVWRARAESKSNRTGTRPPRLWI